MRQSMTWNEGVSQLPRAAKTAGQRQESEREKERVKERKKERARVEEKLQQRTIGLARNGRLQTHIQLHTGR